MKARSRESGESMTQYEMIVHHMRTHGSITKKDASHYDIYDLPGRIRDLKNKGIEVITLPEPNKNNSGTHSRYVLAHNERNENTLKSLGYIDA